MKTCVYLLAGFMVVAVATWAYRVNYATQGAIQRVDSLRAQIAKERQAIAVLQAEWAYLNRPDRLRTLAEAHFEELQLMPLHPDHFGTTAMVDFPPQKFESVQAAIEAVMGQGGNQ
ncbi:MAG: cell division protein FtsL [Paracoccaceae bacterium]